MNYLIQLGKEFLPYAAKFGVFFLVYITPIHPFFITIYILLFFDLFTGMSKSIKLKEVITSKRMHDSIVKLVYYSIAVFISYQVDLTLLSDQMLVLTKLVGGYIMLIEFQSNIENISSITGINLWGALKDKIIDFFNNKITPKTKDNEL